MNYRIFIAPSRDCLEQSQNPRIFASTDKHDHDNDHDRGNEKSPFGPVRFSGGPDRGALTECAAWLR